MKILGLSIAGLAGIILAGLLFAYGTLSPCSILKQELRKRAMQGGDSPAGIEQSISQLDMCLATGQCSQLTCIKGLIKLESQGLN
jgi:hypothetical protein